ncbi:hypothetical protein RKD19_003062 [Streptomyces canus]
MSGTGTADRTAEEERGDLRRSLGFRDLVVYGLLFIAPMAPVGVYGTLDAKSHGAVALVYVVATVAMAFTAFSYAQMVRVVPQAGSVFAYARAGLGKEAGFVAGWMAMLDYLLIPAVAYLFSGIAMNALVPEVSRWVWTALAVVVTTLLNLWGVRAAARVGFLVLAMEIVVLLVFVVSAVVVLARDGAERGWLSPLSGDGTQGAFALSAVIGAVSVAVLSYLGFDAIASFAEEVTGGSENVARAVLFCLAMAGVLFVAQTYLVALLDPTTSAQFAADPARQGSAFYDAVDVSVGTWLHDLVAVSKGDRGGLRGAGGAGGGRTAAVRHGPRPAPAARAGEDGLRRAARGPAVRGHDHAGRGGVGGKPGRRHGPPGLRGRHRRPDRLHPAARERGGLVRGPPPRRAGDLVAPRTGTGRRSGDHRDGDRGGVGGRAGGGSGVAPDRAGRTDHPTRAAHPTQPITRQAGRRSAGTALPPAARAAITEAPGDARGSCAPHGPDPARPQPHRPVARLATAKTPALCPAAPLPPGRQSRARPSVPGR